MSHVLHFMAWAMSEFASWQIMTANPNWKVAVDAIAVWNA